MSDLAAHHKDKVKDIASEDFLVSILVTGLLAVALFWICIVDDNDNGCQLKVTLVHCYYWAATDILHLKCLSTITGILQDRDGFVQYSAPTLVEHRYLSNSFYV